MCALGVKPILPILLMHVVSTPDYGLSLEFISTTGRMAIEQDDWADRLMAYDWLVLLIRNADAALATVMHSLDVELSPL